MAKKNNETLVTFASPTFVSGWSDIYEPDTKGQYADGKYKVTIRIPKDETADLMFTTSQGPMSAKDFLTMISKQNKAIKSRFNPIKDGDEIVDKETGKPNERYAGTWLIKCKTTYAPTVYDTAKNDITGSETKVASGDEIKVTGIVKQWESAIGTGLSFYLGDVMLINKRAGSGGSNADLFGDVEGGFVADKAAPAAKETAAVALESGDF